MNAPYLLHSVDSQVFKTAGSAGLLDAMHIDIKKQYVVNNCHLLARVSMISLTMLSSSRP